MKAVFQLNKQTPDLLPGEWRWDALHSRLTARLPSGDLVILPLCPVTGWTVTDYNVETVSISPSIDFCDINHWHGFLSGGFWNEC